MDTSAISGVLAEATLAYDEQDAARFLGCFTEDTVVRVRMLDGTTIQLNGRAELGARSAGLHAEINLMRHMVFTPTIAMTGADTATAVYQQIYVMVGAEPRLAGAGKYVDRLRRVDGRWLIAERDHHFLTPPPPR